NNVATLNPLTGFEVTGFNPNVTGGTRPEGFAIVLTDHEVYIGGFFSVVRGQAQGQTAPLSESGAPTPFKPKIRDLPGDVFALAVANSTLYAGGFFFEMDGRPREKYAQFPSAVIANTSDNDGDGLPDNWETQFGLHIDPNDVNEGDEDPDND